MYTIKEIILNQKKYKDKIIFWFRQEFNGAKDELKSIKTTDKFIADEKKKLENRFKKIKLKKYLDALFFMNSNRSREFYVWWDDFQNEAIILKYDQN